MPQIRVDSLAGTKMCVYACVRVGVCACACVLLVCMQRVWACGCVAVGCGWLGVVCCMCASAGIGL